MGKESVVEVSRSTRDRFQGVLIAGRTPLIYSPSGGAVDIARVKAAAAKAASALKGGLSTAGKYGVSAAKFGGEVAKYTVVTAMEEQRRKKLGEYPYGTKSPSANLAGRVYGEEEEPFWKKHSYGPDNTSDFYGQAKSRKGRIQYAPNVVSMPYPAGCLSCRVVYGPGSKVIEKNGYYFCPACGEPLVSS